MDFIHYASLQSHISYTLLALCKVLDDFHTLKDVLIEFQAKSPAHFNIPKLHSLDHYEDLIHLFGSADWFNTKSPEKLHINYAKNVYCATNHKDYIPQMMTWLRRQEAINYFSAYLLWTQEQEPVSTNSPPLIPRKNLENFWSPWWPIHLLSYHLLQQGRFSWGTSSHLKAMVLLNSSLPSLPSCLAIAVLSLLMISMFSASGSRFYSSCQRSLKLVCDTPGMLCMLLVWVQSQ